MPTYKTPGVYVEEISTLPPSVAEVSTAIPAFIGCTAVGPTPDAAGNVVPIVARIDTLLDYETGFGGAPPSQFSIGTRVAGNDASVRQVATVERQAPAFEFLLYHSLNLYFKNGGGSCYIVSIGNYSQPPTKKQFEAGLQALEKEDEPTLILLTEAVNLPGADQADYLDLCQQALAQCKKLGDRFAILDVLNGDENLKRFRDGLGAENLMYGAAYYPYLQTTLTYPYQEDGITVKDIGTTTVSAPTNWQKALSDNSILVRFTGASEEAPKIRVNAGTQGSAVTFAISPARLLTVGNVAGKTGADVVTAWESWKNPPNDAQGFELVASGTGAESMSAVASVALEPDKQLPAVTSAPLADLRTTNTALYQQVRTVMAQQRVVLPPSGAVAGVYASVDRARGVWKAPANVALSSVIGPLVKVTHEQQEGLNVDPTAGKSINAIRAFTGKGTLVWGARTLAGNDNEWRYISVRRLFNLIEESAQKATAFAVFEPNDATTWLKVKAMIESYLYGLWEQGALAGPTPEAAYFVNVGLGKTMTVTDVLEGRMIVEIGIAAVRPAEFIVLRFTHRLQQA